MHLNGRQCNLVEQRLLWEASNSSDSQEVVCVLWNLTVHYRVHRSLPFVSVLNQINPFCWALPVSLRSILIIFTLSALRSLKLVFLCDMLIFNHTFLIWFCNGDIPLYMLACLCVLVTLLCVRYCIAVEQNMNDMVTFSTTSVFTRDIRLVICYHIVLFIEISGVPEIYVLFNS